MSASLAEVDPDIAELLDNELGRQRDALEMPHPISKKV
jgi:glycine hydroxymethyltransferase